MSEEKIYPVQADVAIRAHLDRDRYEAMYRSSVTDPASFWAEQATDFLTWSKPFSEVVNAEIGRAHV